MDRCELFPIGLSEVSFADLKAGDSITFSADLDAVNRFAWILWENNNISENGMLRSVVPSLNVTVSGNMLYLADMPVKFQNHYTGLTVFEQTEAFELFLGSLLGVTIAVPVWNEIITSPDSTKFHLVDVALVRLVSYDFSDSPQITIEFVSMADCVTGHRPPVVENIQVETFQNTPVEIKLKARLFNGGTPVFQIEGDQQSGALSFVPGGATVTYLPLNGFVGKDTFHYSVDDGFMSSETAEVVISVLEGAIGEASGKDVAGSKSPDSLALASTNSLAGNQFTFRAWDGAAFSNTAIVTIDVHPSNQPPQAQNINLTVAENKSLAFPLVASDPDGDTLQYRLLTLPQRGQIDGDLPNVVYTPPAFFNGTIEFDYEVEDSAGLKDTATVIIEILPVNDAPVALFTYTSDQRVPPFDVIFDGSKSYDDLGIVEYRWDFDADGITDSTVVQPQFQFDSATPRAVSLTVVDAEGLSDTHEQVLIFNQPPEVEIASPDAFDRFEVGETIDLLIEASDSDGQVETIILLDDTGNEIARTSPSTPLFQLNDLAAGSYAFAARAIDNDGATAESAPLLLKVYKTSGDFIVRPLLLEAMLTEISSEDIAEQNYIIRYSATDPELTAQFEDIRDTGVYLEIPSVSDDGSEEVNFSFDFPFYGQTFTNLYVGSNGLIVLGSSQGANQYSNYPLPSPNAPYNLIAPLWSDLLPTNLGGGEYGGGTFDEITEVHYQEFEDRLIIQYSDMSDYSNNGLNTFQVVLHADGVIDFIYDNVDINYSFDYVVGLQNETGEIGVQVDPNWRPFDSPQVRFEPANVFGVRATGDFFAENGYDQPVTYTITTQDNTVDSLPGNPTWFEVTSQGNTLTPNSDDSVQVGFIADPGFPTGRYEGTIRVDHTQPGLDPYIVHVVMDVVADSPEVFWVNPVLPGYVLLGQPLSLEVSAEDPNGFIQSLSIFADNNLLVDFVAAPYTYNWTPPSTGSYLLKAVATDNDGNVVESIFDLVVTEDTDDDDLPDQWELDFLATMDFDGLDNPDRDGLINLKELFLGTDPNTVDTGTFDNLNPTVSLSITPFDTGEVPLTVNFDASASIDRDGEIIAYEWDFNGDGVVDQSTTTPSVTHIYTEPALYTTLLRVVDDEGATATTTKFVHAKVPGTSVPPSALIDFEVNVPATGQLVDFSALRSTDPDGFIVDYRWNFSDGMELSGAEVQRHFMTNGRHSVTLTVTDNEGMTDSKTEWVQVLGPNRSPGTAGDLWVVSGADYTYTMIDRNCRNWRRTRENSIYINNSFGYETPVSGFGKSAEIGYTFHVAEAGDYYLALQKINSIYDGSYNTSFTSGGGLDVYLDNRRVSPDNGYFNEIDVEPTWGRYGRFYLEPGYHTIAFEVREDSYFEIYRVALARSKESLPTTGSVTQSPQVNRFENEIIPIPEIAISSSAEEVKLGEVVNFSLDEAASDLPNPVLHYFWGVPAARLNQINTVFPRDVSNNPAELRFAPVVSSGRSRTLNQFSLGLIDSAGQSINFLKLIQVYDPVADLSDPGEIVLESEDVVTSQVWSEYEKTLEKKTKVLYGSGFLDATYTAVEAFGMRGETYLSNESYDPTTGRRFTRTGSLDLPVSVDANTRYLALYYNPEIRFYFTAAEIQTLTNEERGTFFDANGVLTDESLRSSGLRVDYSTNGEMRSALVDMRYQLGLWNWFAVVDSGASSEINMTLNVVEEDKQVAFDGLKLIPVSTTDTVDNQLPRLVVSTEKLNDFTYAFDASESVDNDGEILGYLWHFGDGVVSRSSIPQHTFTETGSYEVTLYVLDEDLGLSEWSSMVEVTRSDTIAPVARLTSSLDQGTVPFQVSFSGVLSTDNVAIKEYEIRLPNKQIVFGSEAQYVFTRPGEYLIELTVRDFAGNESKAFRTVEAFAQGVVFNRSYILEDSDVTAAEFVGQGWQSISTLRGNILNTLTASRNNSDFAWFDFMPENSGLYQLFIAASYEQPFAACGLETEMSLTVISAEQVDERNVVLEVNENPTRTRKWNLAGTFDLTALVPISLRLQAKPEATALSIDAVRWIAVDEAVAPGFTLTLSDRTEIAVDAGASTSPEGIVAYSWDFGDGSKATGAIASHSYTDAGLYTVMLTVVDAAGRRASASKTVRILPENSLPQIQFNLSSGQGIAPFKVELDASASTDADGRIIRYLWDFGDGRTGDGVSVSHNYVSPGTYTLTLTLTDDRGGQSSESVAIDVQPPASGYSGDVTRSVETPLFDQPVVFDASNLVSEGSIFTYLWDFGDGTTSTGAQPTHTYTAPGVYSVSVIVTDENGLQTTETFWVSVTKGEEPSDLPARSDAGTGLLVYPSFNTVQQP